ncbi:MAG: PEGA domain-containing protein [Desulfosudis oleivorans]|nr:PEGA domain-containing protein [Desulfosudis oleivorans]
MTATLDFRLRERTCDRRSCWIATVLVDGRNARDNAVTARESHPGNHTVAVSLDGYASLRQTVTVIPGQSLPVTIGLSPVSAKCQETAHAAGPATASLVSRRGDGAAPYRLPACRL